jgi:DNA-binding HxlR family transcriptional regulator
VAGQGQVCSRFHRAVELVGRRWTGAIIRVLFDGPARYNELVSAIPDISDRMLAERLRELEAEELIVRTVIPETPVRVEYALTTKGRELKPALDALGTWAERYVGLPSDPPGRRKRPTTRRM